MDRHRPGYYKEYAERTGKKDRHRPGYYKDYYQKKFPGTNSVSAEIKIPEGCTYVEDIELIVPDWAVDVIERHKNRITPYIWNKNHNMVYLRGGTKCKCAINEDYLEVLKWWDEEDKKLVNNWNTNQKIEIKSIEEEDPEWWDDDEE